MAKKPTTKSPAPTSPKPVPAAPDAPSLKKSYEAFVAAALALPQEKVLPLRLDVNLIFANVQQGVQSVQPFLDRLAAELPKLPTAELAKLQTLAEALLYAHAEAARLTQPAKRAEIDAKLTELLRLREKLLLQAEVFALEGIIPESLVAQIRAGKGLFDAAQDGVALADLYGAYRSQIAGKHPFTDAQVARTAELGHALMKLVTPDGARTTVAVAAQKAQDERDRIFSLLLLRHGELRKAGFYLFGEAVDEKVPTLGARQSRRRDPGEPEPAPAPLVPVDGVRTP
ncbi:MAG: hypothetical protein JNM83_15565 [Myxococcales bacterium]|jgi:hypothetical protein|nr:hypothetical protein [Myxococcales bacterium]